MKPTEKPHRFIAAHSEQISRQTTRFSILLSLLVAISLTTSLFFKQSWLWMDEVMSYILLSDPSRLHMNDAIVSNLDSNPPLYFNVVWTFAHGISLNPYFLRTLSILFFATATALFYRYTTRLTGTPQLNFLIFTVVLSLTYLNYLLSTQIRSYGFYLLTSCLYFLAAHPLIKYPAKLRNLALHWLAGSVLVMTHNFGSFYVAASLGFFALLYAWSKRQAYWWVAASHLLIFGLWFGLWYSSFQIQSMGGEAHSWIPKPSFMIFFRLFGELIPTLSYRLEQTALLAFLPVLRVVIVLGLFVYIVASQLKKGYSFVRDDDAFSFYLFTGCVAIITGLGTTILSSVYISVFLSRYQWPSHLLILFQLAYAVHYLAPNAKFSPKLIRFVPLYTVLLMGFMIYQNRKIVHFPSGILNYLPDNAANYPVFFESADYFLPIWHHKLANAHFLMHQKTAFMPGNLLNSASDYNIIASMREKYDVPQIVWSREFTKARFPHFYVVDESSRYQLEYFIKNGRVKIVSVTPVPIEGHRIVECELL